jgi:hypothetical protein
MPPDQSRASVWQQAQAVKQGYLYSDGSVWDTSPGGSGGGGGGGSGVDSVMWTNQVTVNRADKTITIEATLNGEPYAPEVGFIGFANEDYDTTIFPNNTADGIYQFDATMWNGTDKFEIKVIPGEGDDPAQEYSDYYIVIPALSGATYTTSATMAALHTETVFDKADIYEATRDSIKIGDIVINEHLHQTGRVTALNQPFGGSGIVISTAQLPLNDVLQLDLSSLVPVTNPNGGAEDIVFAAVTNEWSASSLHSSMNKTPNRIDFSWYYPGWGYDSVIVVDSNGNWGTQSVDNEAVNYNASTHILTLKTPQAIVEYVENGGNFAGVTSIEGATETGVKTLTIAEADAVQNFRELHSNDFANVGNKMTPDAVTPLFETLKITGASITVNGNFANLPTNNYYKGIIRQGSSGDIYYEMTDTVTNIRYDAIMPGTATTIAFEQTSIPLKSIEGWNDTTAQHLSHDTSGNLAWVDD